MKKFTILILLTSVILAQQIPTSVIRGLNNELDKVKTEIQNQDFGSEELISSEPPNTVTIEDTLEVSESPFFGYDYFNRDINFFDNIPTPRDFILGPGDEVILSIWGETNIRKNFTINKDGLIFYENIGFISLANKTIEQAASTLRNEFSKIYSTLSESQKSSQLSLELGKIKSINVFFSGQIKNPGINLIHPFSDVFTAIIQAGGVDSKGSLRNIEIIRSNEILTVIDFYSFFQDGLNTFSNIQLIDGDVIHVPEVKKRVTIEGAVLNSGEYELLNNESLDDLIEFAGGLSADASSSIIINSILPFEDRLSDDFAKSSKKVDVSEAKELDINNGDTFIVQTIPSVETRVEVRGRVKNPGRYPSNSSLKEVLDLAGGFNDPEFRKSIQEDILVLRKDKNQLYSIEIMTTYDDSHNIELLSGDEIFVYENRYYDQPLFIRVQGQVNKPGYFSYKVGMTAGDVINLAGGFNELASKKFTITDQGQLVNGADLNSAINPFSEIKALSVDNTINIEGNVFSPGKYMFEKKSINNFIETAGGLKPNTNRKKIYIESSNGTKKNTNYLMRAFHTLEPGDTIFIPAKEEREFDLASFTSDVLSIIMNILAIASLVDNNA